MAISITFRTEESAKMYREIDNFSEMFPQLPRQIIEEVYAVKGSDAFDTLWDLCEADNSSEPPETTKLEPSNTKQRTTRDSNSPENQTPVLDSSDQVQPLNSSLEGICQEPDSRSQPEATLLEERPPIQEEVDQLASDLEKSMKWDGDSQESSQFFGNFVPVSEFSYFSNDELLRSWDAYQLSENVPILRSTPAAYEVSRHRDKETTKTEFQNEFYSERSSFLNKVNQNQGTGFFINPFLSKNPKPVLETSIKHKSGLFLPQSTSLIKPQESIEDKIKMSENLSEQDPKSENLNHVSESFLFLQKTSNSQQTTDETDLNELPLLPPGICKIAPSTDSDETEETLDDLPEASKEQELHQDESKNCQNSVLMKKTKKLWTADSLVLRHCSPHALKFKMKSAIPEQLLNTIEQNCQSLPNFPELKSKTKKLRLKVLQISRSVRQVSAQSRAILDILDSFESNEELVFGYLFLAQTLIKNAKSRTAEGIYSVALVIRHIGSKHPLFIRMIISILHKLSPLTVPMCWSHDEESAEARIEFQKLMGYTFTTDDDLETVQSENAYLTTHSNLVQFYAALLVAAPRGEVFGMEEGWQYLSRLLNALPANRTTATALHAFLSLAGNRLYSTYGRQFEKVLSFVTKRFLSEMDQECEDEAAISRLSTYISLQFYLEVPRCLGMPLNEDSQIIRA